MTDNQKQEIGKEFLDEYLKIGFGIMTKSNLEVLLFHLMEKQECFKGMTNFKISKELRVSEERVAKLAYNAQLLYSEHDNDDERLREILLKAQPKNEGKRIQFSIEDSYLRKLFRSKVREKNQFSDGSFQSDIVSIDVDTYIDIVEDLFYDASEAKKVVDRCKNIIPQKFLPKKQKGGLTFHSLLKITIESAFKELGKVGLDNIIELMSKINISDSVINIINQIFGN